ncbi:hypothetical protein PVAND_001593 [Polypedilum vanderplanki]|uniref:CRAL-TRIO domain-containing protein n=1 Tax=Polypedilum vanderplanki TaxID=319348 RepID=A0A9J6BPQ3_POLVA|nr:hypothetical protein PVAND_001593 [Polypedilum vanderplanki]
MELSESFIEKARVELGENENLKIQCLSELRIWLANHPFIKNCRKDDNFLLQFLRIRKFNVDNACKSFENFFIFRRKFSKWLILNDDDMERVWQLFDRGYAFPLISRDNDGKRIIFIQVRKFDTNIFNSHDAVRLLSLIVATLIEEEETQIAGISSISDYTDVSSHYFSLFSIKDIKDFATCAKNATIGREKENYFVNLPIFASFLFEVGKRALNEKLRSRLILTKNMEELTKNHIDVSILPQEYGGEVSEKEMLNDFKQLYEKRKSSLEATANYDIDWSAVDSKESCSVM